MSAAKCNRKQRKDQQDSEDRDRFIERMEAVRFVPGTRKAYLRAFDRFEEALDRKTGATAKVRDARRYLSRLLEKGVSLRQIQEWLGHSSPTTTTIYAHLTAQSVQVAAQAVTHLMSDIATPI
jgi:integrase